MASTCYLVWSIVMLLCHQLPCSDAQFYVGRYKTLEDNTLDNYQHHNVNDLDAATTGTGGRSLLQKRSLLFSTFNPLSSRGTIYLAFLFLMPLTVGQHNGGRSFTADVLQGVIEREGKSIYNEMGYVDGNLLLRKALKQWRTNLLAKWKNKFAFRRFNKKKKF